MSGFVIFGKSSLLMNYCFWCRCVCVNVCVYFCIQEALKVWSKKQAMKNLKINSRHCNFPFHSSRNKSQDKIIAAFLTRKYQPSKFLPKKNNQRFKPNYRNKDRIIEKEGIPSLTELLTYFAKFLELHSVQVIFLLSFWKCEYSYL